MEPQRLPTKGSAPHTPTHRAPLTLASDAPVLGSRPAAASTLGPAAPPPRALAPPQPPASPAAAAAAGSGGAPPLSPAELVSKMYTEYERLRCRLSIYLSIYLSI